MTNFSQTLYEQICIAFPSTKTRSLSKDCGMSEGYFASTQSQLLPLSTKALTNLANTMDMRANIVHILMVTITNANSLFKILSK